MNKIPTYILQGHSDFEIKTIAACYSTKMKVKINCYACLFYDKIAAICHFRLKRNFYKVYEFFDHSNINSCGKNCSEECHSEGHRNSEENKIFEVLDIFEIENIKLIQINNRGDLLWTGEFEEIKE